MRALVIGAGIFGASAAYHLAQQGVDVVVVDEVHQGKATLAGAGIVCPWATKVEVPGWYALYAASAKYYGELVAGLEQRGETQFGYRKVGALVVAEDPQELEAAAERIARRTASAPEAGKVRRLTPAQARELFPPLREDLEGIHIPGGARVDGRQLAAAMLRAAVVLGATVLQDHVTLRLEGSRAVCRDGNGKPIQADEVIVTAGAWASQILAPLGLDHPVVPQRGQIVHLGMGGVRTTDWPVLLPMSSHYLLAFDDSRVVIGATRENGAGFDYRVTAAGQAEVLNAGLKIAPGLANGTLIETRIGFRPAAPTHDPIVGRVPGIEGLSIGNGLGAGGLTLGPYLGRMLSDIVLGHAPSVGLDGNAPAGPV